jgi:hypothetical protein
MNSFEIDCPWCLDEASLQATGAGDTPVHAFRCATCSIVVELASDPIVDSFAEAA